MRLLISLLLASAACGPAFAQQAAAPAAQVVSDPFQRAEARQAVEKLAEELDLNFVFPDKGKAYASMLRANLASGAYDNFASAKAFADKVTEDLQAVHKDGHLQLHIIPPADRGGGEEGPRRGPPPGSSITKSGWLAPGVAYISFRLFPGNEETMAELRRFLDEHKDAKSLIIDARAHRGGGLDEMDMIFSEIFSEQTGLVMMDTRRTTEERQGNPLGDLASLKLVPTEEDVFRRLHTALPDSTPTALRKAQIYYLTSGRTASAAEHLALAFKRSHRATLIGETTRGAGHYGGMVPVGSIYAAFIPVGRTFDPDTNAGWEGVGVKPDVEVAADKALDEALRQAGVAVSGEAALAALR